MATLLDIRKEFVNRTGRFDLVVDAEADNFSDQGANWFIQAGQRFLERRLGTAGNALAELEEALADGEWFKDFSNIRAVKRVRLKEAGEGQYYLKRESLEQIRERLGTDEDSIANASKGQPEYYALGILRDSTATQAKESQVRLVLFPPADGAYTLSVEALLNAAALSADNSESFWSIMFPDLLVMAAAYKLEVFMRNTQGMNDWLTAIQLEIQGIEFDEVEQHVAEIDQMEDSW